MSKTFVGSVHGWLIVTKILSAKECNAVCKCGNEKSYRRGNLVHNTKSCGCYKRSGIPQSKNPVQKKAPGESARTLLLCSYKIGAKQRSLLWSLIDSDFDALTKGHCHYCGSEPKQISRTQSGNGNYIYNGIDRVDNSRGYISDNCVSCCKVCNRAKDTMTEEEFLSWARQVARNNPPKFKVA